MNLCEEAIKVQDVTFKYQQKIIINHASFTIPKGKISLLMGASGSGKSTLSHIVAGLLPEEDEVLISGKVTVFGKDLKNLKNNIRASYITMMFQNPDLQFCMDTLRKEMRFCLENICVPKQEMDERINTIAKDLSVVSLLDRKLFSLSGGEKQRAALCCLCAIKSKCLILDEPFANLDYKSTKSLIKLLQKLKDEHHITILAIDHKIDYWKEVFDNLIILGRNKKIICDGVNEKSLVAYKSIFDEEGLFPPELDSKKKTGKSNYQSSIDNASDIISISNLIIRSEEETRKEKQYRIKISKLKCKEPKTTIKNKKTNFFVKNNSFLLNENKILLRQKIDINLKKGCMTALLGKSGCGKTTFFLSLLKQHKYSGSIKYNNKEVNKIKLKKLTQHIGIVFQNPINQFVTQNVYNEVAFSIKLWNKNLSENELKNKTLKLLEEYGLIDYKMQSPYLLSQGQMRRLAVLSVLAGGQNILLLDEPTYGQDRKSTETIMKNLKSKMITEGLTIIFTTHDRKLASNWADIVYEIKDKSFVHIKDI